ncbi:MAG: Uncharacterized protein XD63_0169 [Thermoanaerobacterales bacterium 50_218]|nr:MAG: Uncharacterized protein XD63_0169 [Thermoanaerobacterales bacterium 50_218]
MNFVPTGLATGIGSLPHKDPAYAVSLVRKFFPYIPHWPQLPKLTPLEGYLHQFLECLLQLGLLKVDNGRSPMFACDEPDWPDRLARFYELYIEVSAGNKELLAQFAFPSGAAEGFYHLVEDLSEKGVGEAQYLKGQVVGLLSVGFQITDPQGKPAYYDPQLRDVLLKQLCLQAAWQVHTLGRFGLPVLIFMDDPVIYRCGSFDSIGVAREDVVAALREFATFLRNEGAIVGVHTCADLDWSILFESELDVISFDTYQFADSFCLYSELLQNFLEHGGVVAWGIVPTSQEVFQENGETLKRFTVGFLQRLQEKKVDLQLLRSQSLVTPACGTGTLTEEAALRIYELTSELAAGWSELFQNLA